MRTVELEAGTNTINLPQEPLEPGFHLFKAQLEIGQDTFSQNNEGGSYTVVSGKPRVLLVEGETGEARFLAEAITAGGSTLRDFANAEGGQGYFQHRFDVYGREGEPCRGEGCSGVVRRIVQAGRSTFYCPSCQKR